jgi:N-acetylmuramoyl-L-alanine amidase
MPTVREYVISNCSTEGVRGLSDQIFSTLLPAVSGDLVSCEDIVNVVGASTIPYLQPAAKRALEAAVIAKGRRPRLIHAIRTVAQQYLVYYWFRHGRCGITLAAQPSASPHERGIAIDIERNAQWREVLRAHNWKWRGPVDAGHFTYIGGGVNPNMRKETIKAFQRLWNRNNPGDQIQEDGRYGETETAPRLLRSPIAGW